MLPKANRLTKENDFAVVFKKGRKKEIDGLLFKAVKNNLPESRFGFVASKKFFKKAVIRNKIKRRLRSAVAKRLKEFGKSLDVVIVALPGTEKKTFLHIEKSIEHYMNSKN